MARPNIKILGGLQEAFQKADEKYGEVLREIIKIPDGRERLATAEMLVDMLETEIKETKRRLDECRQQEWQREGAQVTLSDVAEPEAEEPPPEKKPEVPYPPMPPARRESIWSDGKLPPDIHEDFRRLSGLSEARGEMISIDGLVKKVAKKLGLPTNKTDTDYGHMTMTTSTPVDARGAVPAFSVTTDTSRQTGMEILWFEVDPESYRQIKNLMPPHKMGKAQKGGRLLIHPVGGLRAN